MSLPPYEPDGSSPPIPAEEVTAKHLVERYEVSKQTLYTRLSAIGVTGSKRGKQVFFSQSEVYQLDAAHFYLGKGYGLKDLRGQCGEYDGGPDSVVDVSTPISDLDHSSQKELVLAPQQEKVVLTLASAVQDALRATFPQPERDPLRSYRLLEEASEKRYQLTSQSLREILSVAQSTINSWSSEVRRNGFILKRVGAGKWRVFRDEEEETCDLAA